MENLGSFLLGSVLGAVTLVVLAWKYGDETVSDSELDRIIRQTDKSKKRLKKINEELDLLDKENEMIATNSPDSMDALLKIQKKKQKLLDEIVSK